MNSTVAVLATLDTRGREVQFVREVLRLAECGALVVDTGVLGEPLFEADVSREAVANASGQPLTELAAVRDRHGAIAAMGRGAAVVLRKLLNDGTIDGALGMGGAAGTAIAAAAMRALPVGFPKLIVSAVASGDTRPYVGTRDITMMYSVVDTAGVNKLSRCILTNAANAVAGMVKFRRHVVETDKPLVGVTTAGPTTACVERARKTLEAAGYELLVFRARGMGGNAMEDLVRDGLIVGVLDITTSELADEIAGGVFSAGTRRLLAPGEAGIPHVIVPGALDIARFGPIHTVPQKYRDRSIYVHTPNITLMRTSEHECEMLGRDLARKANKATGPVAVVLPLKGLSAMDKEGQPFYDPEADAALFRAIEETLTDRVRLEKLDLHINDPQFADFIAQLFIEMAKK